MSVRSHRGVRKDCNLVSLFGHYCAQPILFRAPSKVDLGCASIFPEVKHPKLGHRPFEWLANGLSGLGLFPSRRRDVLVREDAEKARVDAWTEISSVGR